SFRNSLLERVKTRTQEPPQIMSDLTPPSFLIDAISDVQDLLTSLETSLAPAADQDGEVKLILNGALRPYIDACSSLSSDLEDVEREIFNLNCSSMIQVCTVPSC